MSFQSRMRVYYLWSGVMPIPFLSRESPNLAIVDWCLIASQEVSIGEYVIRITLSHKDYY